MTDGFGFTMSYTVVFENATADFDLARGPEPLKLYQAGEPPQTLQLEGKDGYVGELQYLLDCIRNGVAPRVVTAQDGLGAVEICEAEERSIRSGQMVSL